ncbi:hypothetical protein H6P81_020528 [Aristolochia fimbriata]|uniref:Ripening-related protein 1 n=1 Tax=Aristolochia fimbriata TaxID=158543 RepID=A0AAV7DUU8_ARIFI|nr:hypothetical protein H6P81_020528 [Aristolochia fimbriata]
MARVVLVLPSLLVVVATVLSSSHVNGFSSSSHGTCRPIGYLKGKTPKTVKCDDSCCKTGKLYPQYRCSPPIKTSDFTRATMTLSSFSNNGDSGGPTECDDKFHSDDERVVALSTGWYDHGSRCLKNITITGNGRTVLAKIVDECDSVHGCDADNEFQPPCRNNVVAASRAVWKALGIPKADIGDEYEITWSDA